MDKISSAIIKIESALDKKVCKNLSEFIEISPSIKATLLKDGNSYEDTKYRNVQTIPLNLSKEHDSLYHKLIFKTCCKVCTKLASAPSCTNCLIVFSLIFVKDVLPI